ncbi:uncharacterized protein LOC136079681 isoform X4 [Hydra vulgaris]|uniref:Uncharacterized protein LOC136079681 isoform X4 n=1 Tax=Hydra vulgaris TaxID=6087 RepID=A0ABM4BS10_HYDVU
MFCHTCHAAINSGVKKTMIKDIDTDVAVNAIAKIAARMIIHALGENNYFNVITVSNGAKLIEPCVPYLSQATKFNKEKMQIAINKIEKPNNVLNLTNGILLAFYILNSGTEINFELFKEMFDNAIKSIRLNCKTNTTTTCAIIDQNRYILFSNLGDDSIGTFLESIKEI